MRNLLPKGRIAVPREGAKFWLMFLAKIWDSATCTGPEIPALLHKLDKALKKGGIDEWYTALQNLQSYIWEQDLFPVKIHLTRDGDRLSATWEGSWTHGRYVHVVVTNENCIVSWNTATGKESKFLQLPSTAVAYVYGDDGRERNA